MPFDPEEFGQPAEEVSEPVDVASILAMAQEGARIAQQAQQRQPRQAPNPAALARARAIRQQQANLAAARARAAAPAAPPPAPVQTQLQEIEARLTLASYYRALLSNPLFDEQDADEFTVLVEQEVRDFIMTRLSDLLGTSKPKPPVEVKLPFTDVEVRALKVFATLLMKKPAVRAATAPAAEEPEPEPEVEAAPPPLPEPPQPRRARAPRPPTVTTTKPPTQPKRRQPARAQEPVQEPMGSPAESSPAPEPVEEQPAPRAPQGPPPERLPMPQGSAFTAVTANQAANEIRDTERHIEGVRTAVRR